MKWSQDDGISKTSADLVQLIKNCVDNPLFEVRKCVLLRFCAGVVVSRTEELAVSRVVTAVRPLGPNSENE